MGFSKMIVLGNLGRDPELNYTPKRTPVLSFPVCANDKFGDEEPTWFDVNVYGNNAEVAAQHLHKGDTVYVEGTLIVQTWTKKRGKDAGQTAIALKVKTNNVEFVAKRRNVAAAPVTA
jgi:single-strand DNA-binding protein